MQEVSKIVSVKFAVTVFIGSFKPLGISGNPLSVRLMTMMVVLHIQV